MGGEETLGGGSHHELQLLPVALAGFLADGVGSLRRGRFEEHQKVHLLFHKYVSFTISFNKGSRQLAKIYANVKRQQISEREWQVLVLAGPSAV